jgi:two-component system, LytTR family, response regulator
MQIPYPCMIVDDDHLSMQVLSRLIIENCPELKLVATANTSSEAKKQYLKFLPDLIFMDIEVDEQNGFDILKEIHCEKINLRIIFITAFNQFAVEAFKANAIGYLLKPVHIEDLKKVVRKFTEDIEKDNQYDKINALIRGHHNKIRFNTRTGFILLNASEIFYCEADRNYTRIHMTYDGFETISANLSEVEKKLGRNGFWRVNRSYLVNSDYFLGLDRKQKKCFLRCNNREIQLPANPKLVINL